MPDKKYLELLSAIQAHLATFGEARWAPRLATWIREFDTARASNTDRIAHLERTRRALVGMGSIADVVIRPEMSQAATIDNRTIEKVNQTLLRLVYALDKEVTGLLRKEKRTS